MKTLPLTLVVLSLLAPVLARAEKLYSYEDDDGVTVISNVPPGKSKKSVRKRESEGFVVLSAAQPALARRAPQDAYLAWLEEACATYKIPKALALAVMAVESNFDPSIVSHAGASGLMQLMPRTAEEMFVDDIFDPKQNIQGGVRYLRVLANMFDGDMVQIVAAYNAGPDAVRRAGGIPAIAETQDYVKRVLRLYFAYKQDLADASTAGQGGEARGEKTAARPAGQDG